MKMSPSYYILPLTEFSINNIMTDFEIIYQVI